MNDQRSLAQRGVFSALTAIVGLGLLVVLAFSLNALFASRTQQPPQIARQPGRPSAQQLLSIPTPTASQPEAETLSPTVVVEQPSPISTMATNPTAGWNIYTNTAYGFSIKYPNDSNLHIYEVPNRVGSWHGFSVAIGDPSIFSIDFLPNTEQLSLEDWIVKFAQISFDNHYSLQKADFKAITVDGRPAMKVTGVVSPPILDSTYVSLPDKKKVVLLHGESPLFDQMLSTLRLNPR